MNRLSKVPVPESITQFIRQCTLSYGKVKLVLKHNRYYVESSHPETLQMLLKDQIISSGRIVRDESDQVITAPEGSSALLVNNKPSGKDLNIPGIQQQQQDGSEEDKDKKPLSLEEEAKKQQEEKLFGAVVQIDKEDEEDDLDEGEQVHSFEIAAEQVEVRIYVFVLEDLKVKYFCKKNHDVIKK